MSDFFTAQEIDATMRKRIEKYIDEFKHKSFIELLEKDWQSNDLICPFCRTSFPDYTFFLRHFRFYKHRWEIRLLKRIYEHGPKQLEVFDVFYKDRGLDYDLHKKIRFWVLSLKIFEALDLIPYWKTVNEGITKRYINRLFWEKDKQAKN
jgi:hypothetical protein